MSAITLSVILGALESCNRQMTLTMERTARSPIFKLSHDYSNGIFDPQGQLLVQGNDLPVHLGSLGTAMKTVVERFGATAVEGDVFYHNDPSTGGSHLQDMCLFQPIFFEGELMFWAANKAHMDDTGGSVPGGYNPFAEDIFAEGLRISAIRLRRRGVVIEDILDLILGNVRDAERHRADMAAQFAVLMIAEHNLLSLVRRYGAETVHRASGLLLDAGERRMRAAIGEMRDGVYTGTGIVEATDRTPELKIEATARVDGDELHVALTGPPQVDSYINSYHGNTISSIYLASVIFSGGAKPINAGFYRPVSIDLGPEGTLINAVHPAPCSVSTSVPADSIADAVVNALSAAMPDRANAGWCHVGGTSQGGVDPRDGRVYNFNQVIGTGGGAGATQRNDGINCGVSRVVAAACYSGDIELLEHDFPIQVHRWELRGDSGGPGRRRGGLGTEFELEPVGHRASFILWGEGRHHPATPLLGASADNPELRLSRRYRIDADGNREELEWNARWDVDPGGRYLSSTGGGGGIGDPFEREVELVRDDVRNGFVSAEMAAAEYGVVVDAGSFAVDEEATARLRVGAGDRGAR